MIQRTAPAPNSALRAAIYQGGIFLLPATTVSLGLTETVLGLLEASLGEVSRQAQFRIPVEEYFQRLGKVRRQLAADIRFLRLVDALLAEVGFVAEENAIDALRLRAVLHEGHRNPAATPAYSAHRDTWYANPRAQINWWLALHEAAEQETFVFYPDDFARSVANSSAGFDHDRWIAHVGWQNTSRQAAAYPAPTEPLETRARLGFACRAGEMVLFSAGQLHQTRPNCFGLTRFSLDFRTVHLQDHAEGRGSPDLDNHSTGSALRDYRRPPRQEGLA